MHGYGTCYKWAGGCGGKTYASDYYVVWSEKSYSESGDWHGTGVNYVYTDEGLGFAYISTASKYYEQPKEQYRIASRQKLYTYSFYRYGTPYWSESQVSSDNVKLVSTRQRLCGTSDRLRVRRFRALSVRTIRPGLFRGVLYGRNAGEDRAV